MLAAIHGGALLAGAPGGTPAGNLNIFWWQSENITARCHVWIVHLSRRSLRSPVPAPQTATGCAERGICALAEMVRTRNGSSHCRLRQTSFVQIKRQVTCVEYQTSVHAFGRGYFTVVWSRSRAFWVTKVNVLSYGRDLQVLEASFQVLISATNCNDLLFNPLKKRS